MISTKTNGEIWVVQVQEIGTGGIQRQPLKASIGLIFGG
jgi:hypothetical protein